MHQPRCFCRANTDRAKPGQCHFPNETPLKGMRIKDGMALVRVDSHRARNKLARALGYLPQGFFVFSQKGEYREVPADRVPEIITITGIRQAKWRDDLLRYVSWGNETPLNGVRPTELEGQKR